MAAAWVREYASEARPILPRESVAATSTTRIRHAQIAKTWTKGTPRCRSLTARQRSSYSAASSAILPLLSKNAQKKTKRHAALGCRVASFTVRCLGGSYCAMSWRKPTRSYRCDLSAFNTSSLRLGGEGLSSRLVHVAPSKRIARRRRMAVFRMPYALVLWTRPRLQATNCTLARLFHHPPRTPGLPPTWHESSRGVGRNSVLAEEGGRSANNPTGDSGCSRPSTTSETTRI